MTTPTCTICSVPEVIAHELSGEPHTHCQATQTAPAPDRKTAAIETIDRLFASTNTTETL